MKKVKVLRLAAKNGGKVIDRLFSTCLHWSFTAEYDTFDNVPYISIFRPSDEGSYFRFPFNLVDLAVTPEKVIQEFVAAWTELHSSSVDDDDTSLVID